MLNMVLIEDHAYYEKLRSLIAAMLQGRTREAKVAVEVQKGTISENHRQWVGGDIRVVSDTRGAHQARSQVCRSRSFK
eukprot:c29191_g1_i1 orf=3-233(-)